MMNPALASPSLAKPPLAKSPLTKSAVLKDVTNVVVVRTLAPNRPQVPKPNLCILATPKTFSQPSHVLGTKAPITKTFAPVKEHNKEHDDRPQCILIQQIPKPTVCIPAPKIFTSQSSSQKYVVLGTKTPITRTFAPVKEHVKEHDYRPQISGDDQAPPLPKLSSIQGINFPSVLPTQRKSLSLRKVPNTQKSLSLVKSKITSNSIVHRTAAGHHLSETETPHTVVVIPPDCQSVQESRTEIDDNPVSQNLALSPQTAIHTEDYESEVDRLKTILKLMLPANYTYNIVSVDPLKPYHKSPQIDQKDMFVSEVRTTLKTKEDALTWVKDFASASSTDWRVRFTFKENSRCLIFKKSFRCHHNTLAEYRPNTINAHEKDTKCDASLTLTVKNFNMKRSSDVLLKEFPTVIVIHHCHNHPLKAAESLRHRRPTDDVVEKFKKMFQNGYSPSTALHTHQYDIQESSGEYFFQILADGAQCPNLQWCYNLYRKLYNAEYGPPSGEAMVASLKTAVENYNKECGTVCASVEVFEETEVIVAICSPLMKRVHQLKSSGEIGFIDSGGMMDRQNNRVFTLLAPSAAGALPTGLIITSSESEKCVTKGLNMLLDIVPPDAFGGRGTQGPEIMVTDDSTAERNSLRNVFPGITLLLCLFHILQAFWRYIWDSKHKVDPNDKIEVYFLFKEACRAGSEEEFRKKYEDMLSHPKVANNSWLTKHLNDLYLRANEWALSFRTDLLTRGNDTNNYSESNVRRMKDDVMLRLMAYSLVQLFDFFKTRLEAYFQRRIASVLNNRLPNYTKSKHFINPAKLAPLQCFSTSHCGFYLVKNIEKKTEYIVDSQLEICSCPVGKNGAPCKHQMAVVKQFNIVSTQFLPTNLESKLALHKIMTNVLPPPGWYAPLKGPATASDTAVLEESLEETSRAENGVHTSDNVQPESTPEFDEEKKAEALQNLKMIYEYLANGIETRPDTFVSAVDKFTRRFQQAKQASENSVLSALHLFNDRDRFASRTAVRKSILVNKNSVAKRVGPSLAGRKPTRQGRIPKSAFTGEHGYASQSQVTQREPAWNRVPLKRAALPHDITHKVIESSASKKRRVVKH